MVQVNRETLYRGQAKPDERCRARRMLKVIRLSCGCNASHMLCRVGCGWKLYSVGVLSLLCLQKHQHAFTDTRPNLNCGIVTCIVRLFAASIAAQQGQVKE